MDSYINIELSVFIKRWRIILVAALVFCIALYSYTALFSKPSYWCSRSYIITNSVSYSNDESSRVASIGDLNVSQSLAETYGQLIKLDEMVSCLADYLLKETGEEYSYRFLSSCIRVEVGSTEIIKIRVSTGNMETSRIISNAVDTYLIPLAMEVVGSAEVKALPKLLDGVATTSPVKMGIVGFGGGVILSVAIILLNYLFNNKISDRDEFSKICRIPVLGTIPDPAMDLKGGNNDAK